MKFQAIRLPVLFILSILLISGCVDPANPIYSSEKGWKLISFGPVSSQIPAENNSSISILLDRNGRISGNFGCNSFSGDYKISGKQIEFGNLASTMMACSEAIMQQETSVFLFLNGPTEFSIDKGRLIIISNDGKDKAIFIQNED